MDLVDIKNYEADPEGFLKHREIGRLKKQIAELEALRARSIVEELDEAKKKLFELSGDTAALANLKAKRQAVNDRIEALSREIDTLWGEYYEHEEAIYALTGSYMY